MPHRWFPVTAANSSSGRITVPGPIHARVIQVPRSNTQSVAEVPRYPKLSVQTLYADASLLTTLGWQEYFDFSADAKVTVVFFDIAMMDTVPAGLDEDGNIWINGSSFRLAMAQATVTATASVNVSSMVANAQASASGAKVYWEAKGIPLGDLPQSLQSAISAAVAFDFDLIKDLCTAITDIMRLFATKNLAKSAEYISVGFNEGAWPWGTVDSGQGEIPFLLSCLYGVRFLKDNKNLEYALQHQQVILPGIENWPLTSILNTVYGDLGAQNGDPTSASQNNAETFWSDPAAWNGKFS